MNDGMLNSKTDLNVCFLKSLLDEVLSMYWYMTAFVHPDVTLCN